jgi:hypothetical protein
MDFIKDKIYAYHTVQIVYWTIHLLEYIKTIPNTRKMQVDSIKLGTTRGRPQASYDNGNDMCTTAAVCMCVEILENPTQTSSVLLGSAMSKASTIHRKIGKDLFTNQIIPQVSVKVKYVEYVICPNVDLGHEEFDTKFVVHKNSIPQLLKSTSTKVGVLTCRGHTIAMSRSGEHYSVFDSEISYHTVGMTDRHIMEYLDRIIIEQCDFTIIYDS